MELVEERCSQCNFYKCNIHSLSINNFSDNILKCNCSFMDYIWKIKNRNAFKIYVELLMIYMDENDNDYKIDKEIEKLIYSVFNKKDIILINDKEEISNEFKDMNHNIQNKVNNKHNPMESDNSNNKDDEGKKKRIELNYSNINDEKKLFHENDETINGNYLAFRVIKTWLSDNLNNLYGKKLNLILNKLNWYLECFMFGANEISENKLNEFNPLSYDSMNIRINNLLIKFKRKEIKLNKILNEIEIYLNVIKYSEETYSKIIFVLGSFYMHIFYQNYIQSSDSLENRIKYLNIFDYFNSNYLIQLISYNKSWLNTKYNLTTDISITGVKRIKFSNNNNNNNIFNKYLINLKNILNNEDIKNLLNIPIAEKLFLIFNFVVQHQQNDDEKLINNLNGNRRKSNELIQYIVFIYIKIISLMLRQERKDSSIFFFQELLSNISKLNIFSSECVFEINQHLDDELEHYSNDSKIYPTSNIFHDTILPNIEVINCNINLFPYQNTIIIPIISNYYNIYILAWGKFFNISFDQLEYFEKQLNTLKESGKIFFNGWLLLAYSYYKLFSFKKSKKILKFCYKMRFIQKKNNFEDNINVNYNNNNNENNNINIVNNIISNDTDKENNNNINNNINNSNNNNSNNSNNNNNNNNNYKLDYFDSVISLMQGCCYYNIKKFNNSIMKFRACIESNMYYEYSLWNLYLIYKQQDNNEAQMEILFILIQKIIYQKGRIIQDIPINLVFLRMFQLLCETQYEEDIMDYINSISFKKDILFKISNKNDDVSILYLFRNVLRYLIDNKNIEKALDIFIIIISNEPYDIIGSIYYSEILIYYQNNLKLLHKGIRILENIKNYINFVNSSSNKNFLKENDEAIFSNELISTLIKNRNESQNEIEIQNSNDKYDISVEFEKENIEKDYGIIYKYMKMDKILCKDFCDNLANQNYILSIVHWHLSYSYYTLGKLRQAFNSSKVAYLLRPNDITITYNYCILALKIYGINTFEKIAYEWKECRNINKNLETANEIRYKNLDYWMDEIIKHHHV